MAHKHWAATLIGHKSAVPEIEANLLPLGVDPSGRNHLCHTSFSTVQGHLTCYSKAVPLQYGII